ncbi:hypothetical protein B296_00012892 [Ensete ventricosum]|uniref:Uncharacterized protein n=1 Tax=Ensete ventricosum TaxID=4639 RepID=A0A427AZ64_ENSVE|nr:hypothetical protein B296_00012892 [Ensete ventricosum]
MLRVELYEEEASDKQLCENLDLLEEKRVEACLKTLDYKRGIARLYNRKVRPRQVGPDNLVLRKAEVNDLARSQGKLAPTRKVPIELLKSSEKELIFSQPSMANSCRGLGTYLTSENSTQTYTASAKQRKP